MVRLLLVLLLAAFAVPATAAAPTTCHAPVAAPMTEHDAPAHHGDPAAPDKATASHICVGCIPVADWLGGRVARPIPTPAAAPAVRVARLDMRHGGPPALPPPRMG